MDGNYGSSLDLRLPRADTVLWFDYPRHVCLRRVFWRIATTYGRVREDLAPGCPEQLDPGAQYSVAGSEMIVGGGRELGTEPQALASFLAR